ncbi:MAG: TetR/AcrR family transcriptional regulator [Lachnospira sp.]
MSKGEQTSQKILHAARELFYKTGFEATTSRAIAEKANVNLGLLNYYFKSKNEIGRQIYSAIRRQLDANMNKYESSLSEVESFIFSSAIELYLCLNCTPYGNFYHELLSNPANRLSTMEHIKKTLINNTDAAIGDEISYSEAYITMATLSISSIKPTLVDYALTHPGEIPSNMYLKYYIEQQLFYFGLPAENSNFYIDKLSHYHIDVVERFTPIFVPLA